MLISIAIGLLVSVLVVVIILGFVQKYKDWKWNRFVKRFHNSRNRELWEEHGRDGW